MSADFQQLSITFTGLTRPGYEIPTTWLFPGHATPRDIRANVANMGVGERGVLGTMCRLIACAAEEEVQS